MNTKILARHDLLPKVAVVVGTRPGIIKFAPVIKELERRGVDFFTIHTGQHYSPNMDRAFFEALELSYPTHTNESVAGCAYHGEQTAEMIVGVERALLEERPSVVVVGGDANTNLAGALATRKLANIRLAHMEAGLRSHDWSMPEEHNRVMIDHISEILFAPTEVCRNNLQQDGVRGEILLTGNTIVDAVVQNRVLATAKSTILNDLDLRDRNYSVLTLHREENVDNPDVVRSMITTFETLSLRWNGEVVFPIHPRTLKRMRAFCLFDRMKAIPRMRIIDPVDYLDMLSLLANARFVLTDSGGIQEEACVLRVPCMTLRENTERPETITVGANRIVGSDFELLMDGIEHFEESRPFEWENPYGDGHAAERIVSRLAKEIE